jgi:predicted ATPase
MPNSMEFFVHGYGAPTPSGGPNSALLTPIAWDDWFVYETKFHLSIFDAAGVRHDIGDVKLGRAGMSGHRLPVPPEMIANRRTQVPSHFHQLADGFFSVGQDESYYQGLNDLGGTIRDEVLVALNDVALNEKLFERHINEPVMHRSLLRFVTPATVRGQFRRLANDGPRLTPYSFKYQLPRRRGAATAPPVLAFDVRPESRPPSNVHVVIGRNGVGKSDLFSHMTRTFVYEPESRAQDFACVISVSFSAFDSFEMLPERRNGVVTPRFAYVGLRRTKNIGDQIGTPKSSEMLAKEFVSSVRVCRTGARSARWRQALASLEQDPAFQYAGIAEWGADETQDGDRETARQFNRLSSGHKIVLLTITQLVELVEEKTLVLIDEPEGHLHPPLLSAFTRALSDLLVARNGVGLVATHSPVVLQEVPRDCVWKLQRFGAECTAERPGIETFGENVGVLTREVFGLEVTKTGFHQLISAELERGGSYNDIMERFGRKLGAEASALLRALTAAQRDAQ